MFMSSSQSSLVSTFTLAFLPPFLPFFLCLSILFFDTSVCFFIYGVVEVFRDTYFDFLRLFFYLRFFPACQCQLFHIFNQIDTLCVVNSIFNRKRLGNSICLNLLQRFQIFSRVMVILISWMNLAYSTLIMCIFVINSIIAQLRNEFIFISL